VIGAKQRREVLATVRWLTDRRLLTGTSGNVSCRAGDGFLITPTGVPSEELRAPELVEMTAAGRPRGSHLPSSEWRMHRDIYLRRPEVGAIVHTHSTCATALSCLRRAVPAFHYMVAKAGGGDIRCAPYATYGTQALSENALRALDGRRACLLANHGLVALAGDLRAARLLAEEVEALCAGYVVARSVGAPVLLPALEMKAVARKFEGYGQKPRPKQRR
jgi:L-fuculose-phosphate aldolase